MLTKAKSLYQVKLILDYLPEEEYDLIPQETIDYIEDNFEYSPVLMGLNILSPTFYHKCNNFLDDTLCKILLFVT